MGKRVIMQARGVRKAFGGNHVLKQVSFDLKAGEVVLLRGDNGSGKTTLLNILTGNMEPDAGIIRLDADGTREDFRFPRRWWRDLNPFDHFTPERVASEAVGRTWQDVRLFSTQSLLDNIAVAAPAQPGENPARAILFGFHGRHFEAHNREESAKLLAGLGLADRSDSSADRISLGQTKRVAIARAVRAGAHILFLDEPLAGLDANGIEEVMTLLSDLAHNANVTLVIVEHVFNIPRVLDLADTVWTLFEGNLKVETPIAVRAGFQDHTDDSTVNLLHVNVGPDAVLMEHELPGGTVVRIIRKLMSSTHSSFPVLEIRDLVVNRGGRLVIGTEEQDSSITGLNLLIQEGDIAILQAPNGWGKTTLLEAIAGILPIERGEILLQGKPIHKLPVYERIRSGLAVLQSGDNHFDSLTVRESLKIIGFHDAEGIPTSLKPFASRTLASLSGGERQRVALTLCAEQKPGRLRVLDEPFRALDEKGVAVESGLVSLLDFSALLILEPLPFNNRMVIENPST